MYDKISGANRIKKLRKEKGKTQQELASDIGVSVDTIRKLEQGSRMPSIAVVDLLTKYFNTTADYIISGKTPIIQDKNVFPDSIPANKREIVERMLDDLLTLID